MRNVAGEAGLSMGSLRHYFSTQAELLRFAMQLVGDRARARVRALRPAADPRRTVERLLRELVPLDDERRAESEVWLAFTGLALVDPAQRAIHQRIHDELYGACVTAVTLLVDAGLHALVDGLALHAVMRPEQVSPARVGAVISRHLDTLQTRPAAGA